MKIYSKGYLKKQHQKMINKITSDIFIGDILEGYQIHDLGFPFISLTYYEKRIATFMWEIKYYKQIE